MRPGWHEMSESRCGKKVRYEHTSETGGEKRGWAGWDAKRVGGTGRKGFAGMGSLEGLWRAVSVAWSGMQSR